MAAVAVPGRTVPIELHAELPGTIGADEAFFVLRDLFYPDGRIELIRVPQVHDELPDQPRDCGAGDSVLASWRAAF